MNRLSSTLSQTPIVSITSIPKVNFDKKRNVEEKKKEKEERVIEFGFSVTFILVSSIPHTI